MSSVLLLPRGSCDDRTSPRHRDLVSVEAKPGREAVPGWSSQRLRLRLVQSCALFNAWAIWQGRVDAARIQKRLIHGLSQLAEDNLDAVVAEKLPDVSTTDEFHPCRKLLGKPAVPHGVCFTLAAAICSQLQEWQIAPQQREAEACCEHGAVLVQSRRYVFHVA